MAHSYRDLIAWRKAIVLARTVYMHTHQLRKAKEGSKREFTQFLALSRGSLLKVETQVLIAADRQYWDAKVSRELESQTQELLRIMNGLMDSLRS